MIRGFVTHKETSCDLERIRALQNALEGTLLCLLQANVPYVLETALFDVSGSMNVAGMIVPVLVDAVMAKARARDPEAEEWQRTLYQLHLL